MTLNKKVKICLRCQKKPRNLQERAKETADLLEWAKKQDFAADGFCEPCMGQGFVNTPSSEESYMKRIMCPSCNGIGMGAEGNKLPWGWIGGAFALGFIAPHLSSFLNSGKDK